MFWLVTTSAISFPFEIFFNLSIYKFRSFLNIFESKKIIQTIVCSKQVLFVWRKFLTKISTIRIFLVFSSLNFLPNNFLFKFDLKGENYLCTWLIRKVKQTTFHTVQHLPKWSRIKTLSYASGTEVIRMRISSLVCRPEDFA